MPDHTDVTATSVAGHTARPRGQGLVYNPYFVENAFGQSAGRQRVQDNQAVRPLQLFQSFRVTGWHIPVQIRARQGDDQRPRRMKFAEGAN